MTVVTHPHMLHVELCVEDLAPTQPRAPIGSSHLFDRSRLSSQPCTAPTSPISLLSLVYYSSYYSIAGLAPKSVLSPFLPRLPQLPALQCDPVSGNPSCLHLALHPSLPLLRYWFRKPANPHLMTLCWPLPPRGFRRIGGCGPCHLPALLIIYLVGVHRGLPSTELGKALPSFKSGHDDGLE